MMRDHDLSEKRFVYCKTCGAYDKAWFKFQCKKRSTPTKTWKRLIDHNKVYFGYRLIQCVKKRHVLVPNLTVKQLLRRLKRSNVNGFHSIRSDGVRGVVRMLAHS